MLVCTTRSMMVGTPSGRRFPSPFGIQTRLTARGSYVPSRSCSLNRPSRFSAREANSWIDSPSTPPPPHRQFDAEVSPIHCARTSDRSVSNHPQISSRRLSHVPSASVLLVQGRFPSAPITSRTSPFTRRLVRSEDRIEFLSYGPVFRLPLLPTPCHHDAVTVGLGQ